MRRAGRTARRCATASPTAPSRISPRTSFLMWRWRRVCATAISRRRRSCKPISSTASSSWRISATSGSSPAIRRRRSKSATKPRSISWCRCIAANCRNGCRWRRASEYCLPPYDMEAFLIEAELLLDWYLPSADAEGRRRRARGIHRACGATRSQPAIEAPPTWVLRDYHSPNLLWLPERESVARIGAARFPGRDDGARRLRRRLAVAGRARRRAGTARGCAVQPLCARAGFTISASTRPAFARLYATLAAQRATKILGIFARLDRRDGKPQYLRHIPRLLRYLQRSLAHPDLAPLKAWYAANLPPKNQ